jgi:hypothetical protein
MRSTVTNRDDSSVAEADHESPAEDDSIWARLQRGLGPLLGGIALDAVDLVTFGPFGLYGGAILGGSVGWWVGSLYNFSPRGRILLAIAAAVYATVPFTEVLPLATLASAIIRVWDEGNAPPKS